MKITGISSEQMIEFLEKELQLKLIAWQKERIQELCGEELGIEYNSDGFEGEV